MIKTLGLVECANTLVGNASIRGVSGGQVLYIFMYFMYVMYAMWFKICVSYRCY